MCDVLTIIKLHTTDKLIKALVKRSGKYDLRSYDIRNQMSDV
jgi:hypothetical protein